MQPDYQHIEGVPSIQTWEEACVVSQKWADDARLAAQKRRKRYRIAYAVLLTIPTLLVTALLILIIVNHA
jgi:hypothetical protein